MKALFNFVEIATLLAGSFAFAIGLACLFVNGALKCVASDTPASQPAIKS
jgi:hypothetical protein